MPVNVTDATLIRIILAISEGVLDMPDDERLDAIRLLIAAQWGLTVTTKQAVEANDLRKAVLEAIGEPEDA